MCLASVESDHHAMRLSYDRWRTAPMHLGASGKVLLAHLDDAHAERILADPPPHPAGRPQIPAATLRRQIAETRRDGYLVTDGELDGGRHRRRRAGARRARAAARRPQPRRADAARPGDAPRDRARGRRGRGRDRAEDRRAVTAEPVALRAPAGAPLHATVALDGRTLTPATVAAIAHGGAGVRLTDAARARNAASRAGARDRDRGRDPRLRRDDRRGRAARPAGRAGERLAPPARAAAQPRRRSRRAARRPPPSARRWPSGSTSSAPAAAARRTACSTRSRPRCAPASCPSSATSARSARATCPSSPPSGLRFSARATRGSRAGPSARAARFGGRDSSRSCPAPATRWPCSAATP